jgi:hypothetical protein
MPWLAFYRDRQLEAGTEKTRHKREGKKKAVPLTEEKSWHSYWLSCHGFTGNRAREKRADFSNTPEIHNR